MEKIILGSGEIYLQEYTGTIPSNELMETSVNRFGWVSGGASLEYSKEVYTAKDDLGKVKKTKITGEDVKFNFGVCTLSGQMFSKLASTARVTRDEAKKTTTVKLGGIANDDGKRYILRFVHTDKTDGDIRITLIGANIEGINMSFTKDKETVINPSFEAEPLDGEGTLVIYEETEI